MNIILYGPPGSGKSTVGRELATRLGREFVDCDTLIETRAGLPVPRIFAERGGEPGFRRIESEICVELATRSNLVIALGGGALLDSTNRAASERRGPIFCLRADIAELLARLRLGSQRPLLAGDEPEAKLIALLETRRTHYDSFPEQVNVAGQTIAPIVADIVARLEPRSLPINAPNLKHEIVLGYGLLQNLSELLVKHSLTGPAIIVTDENIALQLPISDFRLPTSILSAGEQYKTLDTIRHLYDEFLRHGLDRTGCVIAIGGGVIGDMVGFAAATFMRGLRWVNVPTTLLAMVDASLGGKTGVDLPQGKNLVGAFHPPVLVVSDPLALATLPRAEFVSGMAEVVKHGLIGDSGLFEMLEASPVFGSRAQLQRAIEVKVKVVDADPFERRVRATLNAGHTIGHGIEAASGYRLRHGESIAIGLVAETAIAERIGLAENGLARRVETVLQNIGLPTRCPGLDAAAIRAAMSADKKKASGKLKFALPKRVGEAGWGIEVDEGLIGETLREITL
jgi:shikimate kinase / 3-dehydroquinate synthase